MAPKDPPGEFISWKLAKIPGRWAPDGAPASSRTRGVVRPGLGLGWHLFPVARPQDWPGVHCVTALLTGEPIEGTWFDRTKEWEARLRGEEFGARKFADTEVVNLAQLPCWRHLSAVQYRGRIAELIEAIIDQAAARRAATGIEPNGAAAILRQHAFSQPAKTKKSPAPLVHAASKRVRTEIKIAYAWFARAFREAAEYLQAGDRLARFPRGCFPPGLPFVRAGWLAIWHLFRHRPRTQTQGLR